MAGYSGTPLPRKLGIAPGTRLALVGAPEAIDATPGERARLAARYSARSRPVRGVDLAPAQSPGIFFGQI